MTPFRFRLPLIAILLLSITYPAITQSGRPMQQLPERNAAIPTPESVLGFKMGEDRKLAKWGEIVGYFQRLAAASDRIKVTELGKTTLGRPFIVATISSAENIKRLDEFKEMQRKLADPRIILQETAVRWSDSFRIGDKEREAQIKQQIANTADGVAK